MSIQLRSLTAATFCERVVPALLEREAENSLLIGIAHRVATSSESTADVLFLSIEEEGAVVGATVWGPPHEVVITRMPPGAIALVADYCVASGWPVAGATGPDAIGLQLAEALADRTHTTVRRRACQRVYELTSVDDVPRVAGAMRRAVPDDLQFIATWYAAFAQEVNMAHPMNPPDWARATIASGSAFLWDDGTARCLACLPRETPNGRAIGPVYTPPTARRQGYATSLVAALAEHVLASGKRFACLFTDDDNATSNHIYESIGFRFVCRFDAYALVPASGPR